MVVGLAASLVSYLTFYISRARGAVIHTRMCIVTGGVGAVTFLNEDVRERGSCFVCVCIYNTDARVVCVAKCTGLFVLCV